MGWIRDRLFGGRAGRGRGGTAAPRVDGDGDGSGGGGGGGAGRGGDDLVCDCCNAALARADAYYLPTRTVMISEAHWADCFATNKAVWEVFLPEDRLPSVFDDFLRQHVSSNTPWAVCERCSEFFIFDRAAARADALNDRVSDDNGAVDPAGCVLFAALGWERVHGSWPESVKKPEVADVCDFCEKKMYVGEMWGFVAEETLARYEASGFTDHDRPARVARTNEKGETGWVECQVCLARNLNRGQRADYRPEGRDRHDAPGTP
ncbi:hypothetical protein DMB38_22795 [Streptomyces sp. WAC 06738]|uniref:hypothetical protein n=1 Tax=Streptomyces sp. WAC 06738 TaxID=2203210 RepID=UPI000F6C20EA|nr:hypothetical protein [Streptomyces sp. WAC 06738]AZM48237.1 hypothetical protein DMB38_22795 [Streptomyces sp. WAC 06738]